MNENNEIFLEVDEDLRRIGSQAKPLCPYGQQCYRKNFQHHQDYHHPGKVFQGSTDRVSLKSTSSDDSSQERKKLHKHLLPLIKNANINDNNNKRATITSYFKPRTSDTETSNIFEKVIGSTKAVVDFSSNGSILDIRDKSSESSEDVHAISIPNKRKLEQSEYDEQNLKKRAKTKTEPDYLKSETLLKPASSSSSFDDHHQSGSPPEFDNPCLKTGTKNLSHNVLNNLIQKIFLVRMPDDFFLFWEFCFEISSNNPQNALLETLGFKLVGPFDVLSGQINDLSFDEGDDSILRHWRFFYDPPEFQTFAVLNSDSPLLLEGHNQSYHLGYFRDTPQSNLPLVVSNDAEKSCQITGIADNIFAAFYREIMKCHKSKNKFKNFKLENLFERLKAFSALHSIDLHANVRLKERKKKMNAPTLHKFGIVVPVVKDVGYRELPESDENLKKLFGKITELENDELRRKCVAMTEVHRIMTLINYANDEGDFGMTLEFGIDLFAIGHPFFHRSAKHVLSQAYELLEREEYARIIAAHLQNREKSCQLSVI